MTAFGSVQAIAKASKEDLLKVVNLKVTQALREHFHGSDA